MVEGPAGLEEGLQVMRSAELTPAGLEDLREILGAAWEEAMSREDWEHMSPGVHFLLRIAGELVSHGCVVERELHTGDQRLRTGWVEAVATRPELQGRGHGTRVMRAITHHIAQRYPLGGLDTGRPGFYERIGWRVWRGPTYVRTEAGPVRTAEEDGNVMVLLTPTSPDLDLTAAISCEWRPGDPW